MPFVYWSGASLCHSVLNKWLTIKIKCCDVSGTSNLLARKIYDPPLVECSSFAHEESATVEADIFLIPLQAQPRKRSVRSPTA